MDYTGRDESLKVKKVSRTEIQGGPRGAMAPQKFSVVAAVNLYSLISISDYQICTPFSYVYFVQFLPFISLGSPLAVCTSHQTCPTQEPWVHPKIHLPVISICIEEQKISVVLSQFEDSGIKFLQGSTPRPPSRF